MMSDTALGLVLSTTLFLLIGVGPAAALLRGPAKWDAVLGLGAPVGLALTAVFGTYACQSGWPVSRSWIPITLLACLASLLLLSIEWLRTPPALNGQQRLHLKVTCVVFLIVCAL